MKVINEFYKFKVNDVVIKSRAKLLNDGTFGTHYTDENTIKRINAYKAQNESEKEQSVKDFFKEHKMDINRLDGKVNELELANQVKFIVERDNAGSTSLIKIDNDFENVNKNSFDQNIDDFDVSKSNLGTSPNQYINF